MYELGALTVKLDEAGDVVVEIDRLISYSYTCLSPKEAEDLANAILSMVKGEANEKD